MKKLDSFIFRSYLMPFIATLLLASFILLMQFMWRYIDEIVGKGLDMKVIGEFFFYGWVVSLPLAIPLSILLSSIMSFGNLSEHFELVAIKASGISLLRAMRSLIFLSIVLCMGVFYFSNWILPVVNLKFFTLLYEIRKKMPSFNITPGQFYNELDGYSIRISDKDKSGRLIYDVLMYDHNSGRGNDQVITADKGELYITADTNYLVLKLFDGKRYEEMPQKTNKSNSYEQVRMYFKEYEKKFDFSDMKLKKIDQSMFDDFYKMMSAKQLQYAIDSLNKEMKFRTEKVSLAIDKKMILFSDSMYSFQKNDAIMNPNAKSILDEIDTSKHEEIKRNAQVIARSIKSSYSDLEHSNQIMEIQNGHYKIEWHRKFAFPFGCIVLFFIGAPFGAIIKKGGLGLPMIFSVVFFMIFHILNTIGQKLAQDQSITPFWGMWSGSMILLPLGIYFTTKAINDSDLFNSDFYRKIFTNIKSIFAKKNA